MSINFWDDIEQIDEFESNSGVIEVIPANTKCLATIEEIEWKEFSDENETQFIEIRWSILQPAEFKNRKIFHKVKIFGNDQSRSDFKAEKNENVIRAAKSMLVAIDTIAGGKLYASNNKPTDRELQKALINKQMLITLQIWRVKDRYGDEMEGNWVSKVERKSVPKSQAKPVVEDDIEDDIPF